MNATEMLRAPQLFASHEEIGNGSCFLCSAPCSKQYPKHETVKPSFTNLDIAKVPTSRYVCLGCFEAMGNGKDKIKMVDGSIKQRTNPRGMQPRLYSWVLTEKEKLGATKSHIRELREIILNPPKPPFAIILSDSGQKHILFRGNVAQSRVGFPVLLEEKEIVVFPAELKARLSLADRISSVIGKVAIRSVFGIASYIAFSEKGGDLSLLDEWCRVRIEPISVLAAWLACPKEKRSNQ